MKTMTTKMLFFREETIALLDRLSCALAAKGAVTAEAKKWAHRYKSIKGQVQSGHYVRVADAPDPGPATLTTSSATLNEWEIAQLTPRYTQADLDAAVKAANERAVGWVGAWVEQLEYHYANAYPQRMHIGDLLNHIRDNDEVPK